RNDVYRSPVSARRRAGATRRPSLRQGTRVAWLPETRTVLGLRRQRRDDLRRPQGDRMTSTLTTKPDVDLTEGTFYADGNARDAYRWMRANEPVFRDRNGLAAAASYQALVDAE